MSTYSVTLELKPPDPKSRAVEQIEADDLNDAWDKALRTHYRASAPPHPGAYIVRIEEYHPHVMSGDDVAHPAPI